MRDKRKKKYTKKVTLSDNGHFINLKSLKIRIRVYQQCESINVNKVENENNN